MSSIKSKAKTSELSVKRIYSEPNLSGYLFGNIGWSPDGKTLTYIRGKEDDDEVIAYDIDTNTKKSLFCFSRLQGTSVESIPEDDFVDGSLPVSDWKINRIRASEGLLYKWMPSGEQLIVSKSGGVPQLLDLKSDNLFPLTTEATSIRNIRVSPDGQFVSFVREWDLFMVEMATGKEVAITTGSTEELRSSTPDTMGDLLVDSGHWWSPDSTRIAFLQTDEREVPLFWYANLTSKRGQNNPERFPQPGDPIPIVALNVFSKAGYQPIDTSPWPGYYLARVTWLPDSRYLALQMLSREQNELSLVLADSFTGATKVILTETDPAWINVVDDLRFFPDSKRFIWSSERDSYRHLYLYDIDGNELLQLTSGPEACVAVEGFDEPNCAVYYLIYPAPYTDGRLKRVTYNDKDGNYSVGKSSVLTTEPGTHFAHLSPDCQLFADLYSTSVQPPCINLRSESGKILESIETNPCDELANYQLKAFKFDDIPAAKLGLASDDMRLHLKLLEPYNLKKGEKYPVIVYIYGGPLPGGYGLARNAINIWRPVPELWLQVMAKRGYGILTLDNRGSNAAPRGHDWETPIHNNLGHVELADQLEGVKYLKSLSWVDPDRIGIIGGSFGGFMTMNAMLRASGTYKVGLAYAPVTNWRQYDCVYTERYMGMPDQNSKGYDETAVTNYADQLEDDLLIIHGANDPNVHLQHTFLLSSELISHSKNFQMMLYPGQVHMSFFGMGQSPERLWARITYFFMRKL